MKKKIIDQDYILSNGVAIPKIGFGTWRVKPGKEAYESVLMALRNGYRHIDTATVYKNEKSVGQAIKDSALKREDIFVTTKLPSHVKSFEGAKREFAKSLKRLGLSYVDLYLIHAPWPWIAIGTDHTQGNIEAWKAMIELYNEKKIRAIGVSNFAPSDIEPLIQATGFVPHVNQLPFYVGKPQLENRAYCQKNNILFEAYSPLMSGRVFKLRLVNQLAEKYGVTPAQIALRYTIQQNTLPLPKSTHEGRIINNAELDFVIAPEDMEKLEALHLHPKSRF
ncbi:MAG: aldo/keto reductase [Epsilonproteobacteria bacterium]|jgi:diketogulonate reductase-like aldo/keto reductase|nr:aldo/keto reductase [Campylobacterota bacterium]